MPWKTHGCLSSKSVSIKVRSLDSDLGRRYDHFESSHRMGRTGRESS